VDAFAQQLFNGVFLGAIYALIALGYTMIYGVLRFINFAHGDVYMIGAFAAYFAANRAHGPLASLCPGPLAFLLTLLIAMVCCAALGALIERLAYRPLRHRPRITVLITAIGVSLLLQYGGQAAFSPDPRAFPELLTKHSLSLGPVHVTSNQLLVLAVTVALMLALRHFVLHTRMGKAMRAVAYNPSAASLMGVNTDVVISCTFAIGSALAAAAGVFYSINYPTIDPLMGMLPGMKAFVAAVLGGIGHIPGAALGGLILGVVETFVGGSPVLSPYRDAVAFALLIVLLLFRPGGLLGQAVPEKV
jgi:branched-chain amino acid transport system permease protein